MEKFASNHLFQVHNSSVSSSSAISSVGLKIDASGFNCCSSPAGTVGSHCNSKGVGVLNRTLYDSFTGPQLHCMDVAVTSWIGLLENS